MSFFRKTTKYLDFSLKKKKLYQKAALIAVHLIPKLKKKKNCDKRLFLN